MQHGTIPETRNTAKADWRIGNREGCLCGHRWVKGMRDASDSARAFDVGHGHRAMGGVNEGGASCSTRRS